MKNFIFYFVQFFVLINSVLAQHVSSDVMLDIPLLNTGRWEQTIDFQSFTVKDFIAISIVLDGEEMSNSAVRCSIHTVRGWQEVPAFGEDAPDHRYVSELTFLPVEAAGTIVFHFEVAPGISMSDLKGRVHIFSPTGAISSLAQPEEIAESADGSSCECSKPAFIPRSSWGIANGLNGNIYIPPAVYTNVSHLIVHHSAGTNSSNNWPGVVDAVFDYHVNTNGWSDIGYNWLIDPNGVLYEGRGGGDNVRGSHMCGYNNNTMGVCLLGNFVNVAPSTVALETLTHLLAWKCCKEDISPGGNGPITSYAGYMQHISGHRDGCAPNYTECPGGLLYTQLGNLRLSTETFIQNGCNNVTGTFQPVQHTTLTATPNPARDRVRLQWEPAAAPAQLRLSDALGHTVGTYSVDNNASEVWIPVYQLPPGLYWVTGEGNGPRISTRFIKF